MTAPATAPTPYPDVNTVLAMVLAGAQDVLGRNFVGMYLHGSLASGDFDPQSSDIDFVVVTASGVPDGVLPALEAMHRRIGESGLKWAARLDGIYVTRHVLRRYHPDEPPVPTVDDGRFHVASYGRGSVIQRHILREWGVVVAGPSPQTFIDPVQPDELRRAVLGILREWWTPMLADPARLRRKGYQPYAILTMCRMLYTLHSGAIISKLAAARWAQETLDEQWMPAIQWALAAKDGGQRDDLNETLALLRHTLERSRGYEQSLTGQVA